MSAAEEPRELPSHYDHCFGCGSAHPAGLHVRMAATGDRVVGSFEVTDKHQGAPGLAHGGIISAAVDEGMGYLLWLLATPAVTARLEVDFVRPVPVGSRLELDGRLDRVEGRRIFTSMTGRLGGDVAVRAKALYIKVGVDHFVPHAQRIGAEMSRRPYNP